MTYAAYLRIYEPVAAFHEPDRSRWAAYAASPTRPRHRDSLAAEQAEALHRVITAPGLIVPSQESEHAYVRRAGNVTYICPWQIRLRCQLSYHRTLAAPHSALRRLVPPDAEHETAGPAGQRPPGPPGDRPPGPGDRPPGPLARLHILASSWTVPLGWFVPFAGTERWLALGTGGGRPCAAQTASATRALLYATPMSRARRRVARGLAALRGLTPGPAAADWDPDRAEGELAAIGQWLAGFHPHSLVELDYGGLVQLLSDDALSSDQSAAEIRAAIDGAARGQHELAAAMYRRAHTRWRSVAGFELAN
jgi:hypothetical protein